MLSRSLIFLACLMMPATTTMAQQDPPAPAAVPSVTLPADLDRVLRDYEREWTAGSAAGLAALFAEDGFVLQSGRGPVRGRAAITQVYGMSGGPLALRALAWSTADTLGYIIGAYGTAAGAPDAGKFILLLNRKPGQPWRIMADMDNGNTRGR